MRWGRRQQRSAENRCVHYRLTWTAHGARQTAAASTTAASWKRRMVRMVAAMGLTCMRVHQQRYV